MKTTRKVGLVISLILATSIFVSSCVCVYLFKLNDIAFWWTWLIVCWVEDIVVASILFNSKHSPDEAKVFWLLILIILPVLGGIIAIFAGLMKHSQKGGISRNHAMILRNIFEAKKSIKFCCDSFFVSSDTFNALNFCAYKNVKVDICIGKQAKRYKNNLMIYNLDKNLESGINIGIHPQIKRNFLIIDDKKVLVAEKNFNFRNIFNFNKIIETNDINEYLGAFKLTYGGSINHKINKGKKKFLRRLKSGFFNIFYLFM